MTNKHKFRINQGSDVSIPIVVKDCEGTPVNFTGFLFHMQLRRFYSSQNVDDELSSEGRDSRIVVDPENGQFTLIFPNEVTKKLSGSYLYDIETTSPDGRVERLLQGSISISPEVTREDESEEA